ncbi:hypothetical protein, partial [uncultured Selenomonas sp.]|uniref:hypothetical protein n=1 Tax=uncultured Selenomonas sp. TaxID=159275 RepID=UPI002675349E
LTEGVSTFTTMLHLAVRVEGIADKMKSVRLVQNFCPDKETNRTHSKSYVEDLLTQAGRKGCTKMAVLNLSVLP